MRPLRDTTLACRDGLSLASCICLPENSHDTEATHNALKFRVGRWSARFEGFANGYGSMRLPTGAQLDHVFQR